jgi:hypothetical protein
MYFEPQNSGKNSLFTNPVLSEHLNLLSYLFDIGLGLSLWCLMPLSTIFQLSRGGQFYCWRNYFMYRDMQKVLVTVNFFYIHVFHLKSRFFNNYPEVNSCQI